MFITVTDALLQQILKEERRQTHLEWVQVHLLRKLVDNTAPPNVLAFTSIEQENPMVVLDPGATGAVFSTTTLPVGSTLPTPPVWTVNDPNITLVPQTADSTGLSIGVNISTAASVGEQFTLTITGTNADGSTATQSNTFSVGAPPPVNVTGFAAITQTQ